MINSNSQNMFYETSPKNAVVVGKIYANWCGHCKELEPEWENVMTRMDSYINNNQIKFEEIEQTEEDTKLPLLNNTYLNGSAQKVALQAGYPTIFCIKNNAVEYYNGQRNANSIYEWCISKIDTKSAPETNSINGINSINETFSLKKAKKMNKKTSKKMNKKNKTRKIKNKFMSKANMKKSIKRKLMNMRNL